MDIELQYSVRSSVLHTLGESKEHSTSAGASSYLCRRHVDKLDFDLFSISSVFQCGTHKSKIILHIIMGVLQFKSPIMQSSMAAATEKAEYKKVWHYWILFWQFTKIKVFYFTSLVLLLLFMLVFAFAFCFLLRIHFVSKRTNEKGDLRLLKPGCISLSTRWAEGEQALLLFVPVRPTTRTKFY